MNVKYNTYEKANFPFPIKFDSNVKEQNLTEGKVVKTIKVYNKPEVPSFPFPINAEKEKYPDAEDVQFKPIYKEEGVSAEAVRMAEATLPPGFERVEINIDVKPNTDDIETVIKGGVVHRVIDGELIDESKLTPEDLQEAAKKLQEKFKK